MFSTKPLKIHLQNLHVIAQAIQINGTQRVFYFTTTTITMRRGTSAQNLILKILLQKTMTQTHRFTNNHVEENIAWYIPELRYKNNSLMHAALYSAVRLLHLHFQMYTFLHVSHLVAK